MPAAKVAKTHDDALGTIRRLAEHTRSGLDDAFRKHSSAIQDASKAHTEERDKAAEAGVSRNDPQACTSAFIHALN